MKNAPISHNRVNQRHSHYLKFVVRRFIDVGGYKEFDRIYKVHGFFVTVYIYLILKISLLNKYHISPFPDTFVKRSTEN